MEEPPRDIPANAEELLPEIANETLPDTFMADDDENDVIKQDSVGMSNADLPKHTQIVDINLQSQSSSDQGLFHTSESQGVNISGESSIDKAVTYVIIPRASTSASTMEQMVTYVLVSDDNSADVQGQILQNAENQNGMHETSAEAGNINSNNETVLVNSNLGHEVGEHIIDENMRSNVTPVQVNNESCTSESINKNNIHDQLIQSKSNTGTSKGKSGPIFHGLKRKPVNMGTFFKKKKPRNLFKNLKTFAENNQSHVSDHSTDGEDDDLEIIENDAGNLKQNKEEDELLKKCLNTKVTVELNVLDTNKLSASQSVKRTESPEKTKSVNKKEPIYGSYGKKKKNKPSAKLLREIDKKPAKRFKKVPDAEVKWNKIERMENDGINFKRKQGREPIKGKFPCDKCDYVAKQKSHLSAHRSVHARKFVKCKYCKFESRSESKLMEHEARHTGEKPFVCEYEGCDYAGVCKQDLIKHQRKHAENKAYKCPHCDFSTKWPRNIQSHLLTHTNERPHVCKLCGFAFKRSCDLKYHMYRHSDLKPIKCDKCDFRCKTNFEIKCHKLKHSDVRYFKCTHPGCTQETKTKSDLTKHMKVHLKTFDYKCDLCGKCFKTKSCLKKHMMRHSNERPWKCDICGRGFKLKPALRNHINMHANYKPHSCEYCGMLFASLGNKRTHMVVHSTKDRTLKCPICPYLGKTQDHILSHIGTMHGSQYAYFCEICKKPFKRYHLLQVHYPRCHTKEEMRFMENAIQLNIQAIKSEATGEISHAELAEKNAELNWDCIIVKDERIDETAENQNTTNQLHNKEDLNMNGDDENEPMPSTSTNHHETSIDQNKQEILNEQETTDQNEQEPTTDQNEQEITNQNKHVTSSDQNEQETITDTKNDNYATAEVYDNSESNASSQTFDIKEDIKPKKEFLDYANQISKPAIIAIYDGFRLPLATVGFQFNFIKKGKKTNAWFMDSNLMDETAKKRHIKYLNKKKEQVLYGYYSSKRRRRVAGKLTHAPIEKAKKSRIKREFAGGKFIPKVKGEVNTVRNFFSESFSQHSAKKTGQKHSKFLEIGKSEIDEIMNKIKKSPTTNDKIIISSKQFKKYKKAHSKEFLIHKSQPKTPVIKQSKEKRGRPKSIETTFVKKKVKSKREILFEYESSLGSESESLDVSTDKEKPKKKPQMHGTLLEETKSKAKVGRPPKVNTELTMKVRDGRPPKDKVAPKMKVGRPMKAKVGRPPKVKVGVSLTEDVGMFEEHNFVDEETKPKAKPGRPPKVKGGTSLLEENVGMIKKVVDEEKKTKGKPGRPPKVKTGTSLMEEIVGIFEELVDEEIKPKSKPGRPPKEKVNNSLSIKNFDSIESSVEVIKPKAKPGRPPKVKDVRLSNPIIIDTIEINKVFKPKAKVGRPPKIKDTGLSISDMSEVLKPKAKIGRPPKLKDVTTFSKLWKLKGKPGRKPGSVSKKILNSKGKQPGMSDNDSPTLKRKPGRPKNTEKSPSKAGPLKVLITKKKPGRKPKSVQGSINNLGNKHIKQEVSDDLDNVTASISDDICPDDVVAVGQDFSQSCDFHEPNIMERLKLRLQQKQKISALSEKRTEPKKSGPKNKHSKTDSENVADRTSRYTESSEELPPITEVRVNKNTGSSVIKMGPKKTFQYNFCGPKKRPEIVIENAEENPCIVTMTTDNVYPVSLHAAAEYVAPNPSITIKEEINEYDNSDVNLSNQMQRENLLNETTTMNPDLQRKEVMSTNCGSGDTIVPYCDDVIVMRRGSNFKTADQFPIATEQGQDNSQRISTTNHLGIRIESTQSLNDQSGTVLREDPVMNNETNETGDNIPVISEKNQKEIPGLDEKHEAENSDISAIKAEPIWEDCVNFFKK